MTSEIDSLERARAAFRQSRRATVIVAADAPRWTVLDVNDAYLAVTHRTRETLVGRPLFEEFPESADTVRERGSHQVKASFARAVLGEQVILPVQRYDLSSADGAFEEHYWEMSSVPLLGAAGEIIGVLHEVEDVTAREQAERENRRLARELEARAQDTEAARRAADAAERQLQTVFAQTPAALAVTIGEEHRFILANRGYQQLVGRAVSVGATFREALPEIASQGYEALLDGVFRSGLPFSARESPAMLDKGGAALEQGWYDFVYQPLVDVDGVVIGVLQQGIDVTTHVRARQEVEAANMQLQEQAVELEAQTEELQTVTSQLEERTEEAERVSAALEESERQFRTLADAIPTLAWTARADGYIDWYNARWYEFTGTMPGDMEGWGWRSVHHPETLPAVIERWMESVRTGQPFEMTFPLRAATGEYRRFLTRASPVRDANGTVLRWFGTNTDVEAERIARASAEQANRAKSEFLATMSHELRTPLNAIAGYTQLLDLGIHGPVTEPQHDALRRIQRSQRHLLGLINDVLNFAKLEAGRVEYSLGRVRIRDAIDALEPLVATQIAAKVLRFDRSECLGGETVYADPDKLQQILLNLMSNAIKFTPHGGAIVLRCDARGDEIRLAISDTGIGIPVDRQSDVFEPFVQVGRRLNAPGGGTGLGLAISRDLARGMDGDLTVESTPGGGSIFTVTLPAAGATARV